MPLAALLHICMLPSDGISVFAERMRREADERDRQAAAQDAALKCQVRAHTALCTVGQPSLFEGAESPLSALFGGYLTTCWYIVRIMSIVSLLR